MTARLWSAVTILAGVVAGCGGSACDESLSRIQEKVESCGGSFQVDETAQSSDEVGCTAALGKKASDDADAIEAVDCPTLKGWYPPR